MPSEELIPQKNNLSRYCIATVAVFVLASVYLFQSYNFSGVLGLLTIEHPYTKFVVNRLTRFLLNEFSCLLLIIAIFNSRKYIAIGLTLFAVELFILLPLYFVIKLSIEGDTEISSPLLSQFHRIIVNPLLMLVLIGGLLYQDKIIHRISR